MKIDLKDSVILFIGKRGCGKTVLLKSLLDSFKHEFHKTIAICPTDFNGGYRKMLGENNAIQEFDDAFLGQILDKMKEKNENKVQKDEGFKRLMLILDDCISDINFSKCRNLKKIVVAGRHYGISLLFTSQYIRAIPPIVRNNADYLLIGRVNAQSFGILNEEFNTNKTKKDFMKMLSHAGNDFKFLIISTGARDNSQTMYRLIKAKN